jgi:hypothetical protein
MCKKSFLKMQFYGEQFQWQNNILWLNNFGDKMQLHFGQKKQFKKSSKYAKKIVK